MTNEAAPAVMTHVARNNKNPTCKHSKPYLQAL